LTGTKQRSEKRTACLAYGPVEALEHLVNQIQQQA
jgi:hypothetical protein